PKGKTPSQPSPGGEREWRWMTAIDADHFLPDLDSRRQRLEDRLRAFSRQVRIRVFIAGAARIVAEIALFAIASFILDRWLRLSLPMRLSALCIGAAILAWQIWKHLIDPLKFAPGPVALAATLDRSSSDRCSRIAPRVASVLQLPRL